MVHEDASTFIYEYEGLNIIFQTNFPKPIFITTHYTVCTVIIHLLATLLTFVMANGSKTKWRYKRAMPKKWQLK